MCFYDFFVWVCEKLLARVIKSSFLLIFFFDRLTSGFGVQRLLVPVKLALVRQIGLFSSLQMV